MYTGVPVSNQWDKNGYIYPIQVAQYGLSHYSKSLTTQGLKEDRWIIQHVSLWSQTIKSVGMSLT